MSRIVLSLTVFLVLGLGSLETANGDLTTTIQAPNGESSMVVQRGESFTLHLNVDSDSPHDLFQSFGVDVRLSSPGLILDSYDFPSPVLTVGGPDDWSTSPGALGTVIEFTNLTDNTGDTVGEGTLVTIDLMAPNDFPVGKVEIVTNPDFFHLDLILTVDPEAGPPFSLNIVPEPMTMALLGVGGLVVLRRRRSAQTMKDSAR